MGRAVLGTKTEQQCNSGEVFQKFRKDTGEIVWWVSFVAITHLKLAYVGSSRVVCSVIEKIKLF